MTCSRLPRLLTGKFLVTNILSLGLVLGCVNPSFAGPREQAYRIYTRLTGTPPTNAMLDTMTACINGDTTTCTSGGGNTSLLGTGIGQAGQVQAAYLAMQDPNNPSFLNVKVKNMVIPWTNKDQTVFFPFNDAAATLVGLIRDGQDFRQALYGDVIYYDPGLDGTQFQLQPFVNQSASNNNHYKYIEHNNLNLQDPTVLQKAKQSDKTGMPATAVAGVMTTRAMQRAFFYAGTNRAMLRFTFINFMCNDFGQIKDVTSNPDRVRQDPSRSPGGDSSVYLNNCIGCHAGMDGLAGAYAYYNWGPQIFDDTADPNTQGSTYLGPDSGLNAPSFVLSGKTFNTRVMPKYLQNFLSFPGGFETQDDSWENYWRVGLDANLDWANNNPPHVIGFTPGSASNPYPTANGQVLGSAAQLGYELANSGAFARCQVLQVYRQVCSNDPTETKLQTMVNDFTGNNYNMLTAFSDAAIDCSSNLNP